MSSRVRGMRFGQLPLGLLVGVLAAVYVTAMVVFPASALAGTRIASRR